MFRYVSSSTRENSWRWRVDFNFLIFIVPFLLKYYCPVWFFYQWNLTGQFISVFLLLNIMFGLTADGGKSILGKICRYLISYLTHSLRDPFRMDLPPNFGIFSKYVYLPLSLPNFGTFL